MRNELISFHIAGDNGVGKTFAATLLAQSMFQYEDNSAVLVLMGTNFEGDSQDKVIFDLVKI